MGIYSSHWASRGWTTQEDFMVTRLSVFGEQGISWECLSHAEKEDGTPKPLSDVDKDDANGRDSRDYMSRFWKRALAASGMSKEEAAQLNLNIPTGFWNGPYSMWYTTISEYSDRRLTNLSDRLPALSGLAAVFHQATGDEYCAGLWKSDLLRGLLWQYRPTRGKRSHTVEMFRTDFDEPASKLDAVFLNEHLQLTGSGPSWSRVSLEGWLEETSQRACNQFFDIVVPATRILDVQVDLVAEHDPFGHVSGGRLTIEAASVEWDDSFQGKDGEPASNMRKFVAELLGKADHTFTAEYQLRHQPHEGQLTAALLIDCNSIEARAIIVESAGSSPAGDGLYRRVGRVAIRVRVPYDESIAPDQPSYISPIENSTYGDCAKGRLPMKTFVIV